MEELVPFEIATCEMTESSQWGSPLAPDPERPFHPFRIQDPFGLRNAVVPVFRQDTNGQLFGFGTAFNIDQFGTFLTAHHVIDFSGENGTSRPVLLLSMHAIVIGSVAIPNDCFVPVTGYQKVMMDSDDPIGALRGSQERKVAVDLAVMQTSPLGSQVRPPQTVSVCINGWRPRVGDILLAVGYPELDFSELSADSQKMLLSEGMYGAYGRIVDVHLNGVGTANPSPVIEVETDWPPGMSGGPVFNRAGDVVGIVSRSIRAEGDLPGRGYAVDLGRAYEVQPFAPSLDAPGWQVCWGLFLEDEFEPFSVHVSEEAAVSAGNLLRQPHRIVKIANKIGTKDYMLI
ncbi:serine protease [Pseudomonas sp. COR58]|uniref:Serine protease n=1 Tax=Pseudomonas ekonensis TaxID=2842353 RepID=A0ABS6PC48_9PSED|nr:serine protease [Pseudomonas ekonensis]MBV4458048.1 serine protease [Pseudomonas ekonensis]